MTSAKFFKKRNIDIMIEEKTHLSEAIEADGKLEVGNWAAQLLHKRPWT